MAADVRERVATRVGSVVNAVARRTATTSLAFERSAAWAALIESLQTLAAAFDFGGVIPREDAPSHAPSDLDPDDLGERLGRIVADVLRTDGIVEAQSPSGCTLLIGAQSVRALSEKGADTIADAIEDLQLRVVASLAAEDRVQLQVCVGPERHELGTLRLAHG